MNKIYTGIIYAGLSALMIFSPLARGATTSRPWAITIFMFLALTVVFAGLLKMVGQVKMANKEQSRDYKSLWSFSVPVLAFVLLSIISFIFSIYKHDSFFALLRLLLYVALVFIIASNYSKKLMTYFVLLILCIAFGLSVYGLLQYFFVLPHSWWEPSEFLAASYVNHNHFAGYLEMAIPLLIGVLLTIYNSSILRLRKIYFLVALTFILCVLVLALIFAQSRGAWISLSISLLLMNVILIKRKLLRPYSLAVFLFFLLGAFSYIYYSDSKVSERLETMVDFDQAEASMSTRLDIWKGSTAMIADYPLTGVGIGCFEWGFPKYRPEVLGRAGIRPSYAHNDYLQMMAEMGLFSLPLIFWILLVLISRGLRHIYQERAKGGRVGKTKFSVLLLSSCAVGILSLSLHAFVDFNFHIPANMLTFVVLSGIILGASSSEGK